tara:strand:+ start:11137 stop:11835 length:699 start_codon:yes stop_codon:yes gene_type:complete
MTQFAKTSRNAQGNLIANDFEDVYFSPKNGLEETRHVFLKGNHLPSAWANKEEFTIIETGFGTGLNFFATIDLWEKTSKNHEKQQLHFISTEMFPLKLETFKEALNNYPELKKWRDIVAAHYPTLIQNQINSVQLSKNIKLTLMIGDVMTTLPLCKNIADAWYLDGFAPSRNPQMWNLELYKQIFKLSHKGTTLATFTAAAHVRRGLAEAGFYIERIKGYAYKKHMTSGKIL